jgi:hypothetical protein
MSTYLPSNSQGAFLTTSEVFPEDNSQFLIKLTSLYTQIANAVNLREIAQYDLIEFITGEQWFTTGNPQKKRSTFRKVFNIGAIATGATSNTAHGLTGFTAFTHIYGTCVTDVVDYRPIPYASATLITDQIEIKVGATNITIISGATAPNITSAIVVLEFLKN